MTYLVLITRPNLSTDIVNAMVVTVADTLDQAYAGIIDYRDNGGVPDVLWQALILDDQNLIVSRLMAGEGPDITRALALAWGVRSSALRVHVFVGASSTDDDGEVTSLESITAAELISEGDDLPQDDDEIEVVEPVEENVPDPVEETGEQS
ncbi:hypothetical protein [Sphingobium yanoikuyae]|uniref:hypothetical protein n=1 Tax=Sphingobium yanoikuyae TaxID=13690 RepID=UPI0013766AF7|nr:hypothetical protein [Sphingobium yanoikuyae]NBB38657.1 hypothetical protein [Sphingobium yanoikuyae]